MTDAEMAAAFNEWMREYTDDPKAFEVEFKSVQKFLATKADGGEPSYGAECVAVLKSYHTRLTAAA